MAANADATSSSSAGDPADGETVRLAHSQADAVLARDQLLRERVDGVLGELEADVRCDPARLTEDRLGDLDDVIGDLMSFSNDLRKLEGREGDDGPE